MTLEKPKSITITIGDRKSQKFTSFVVYGIAIEEVERKVKKLFEK